MAKTTQEEIEAMDVAFTSRLLSRALTKIRQGASEQEVRIDLAGFNPPRELVREGIDIRNRIEIAIAEAQKLVPSDAPKTLLLPQLDVSITAPAPPNEALQRIAALREQISELEMAAFDVRKQTLLSKVARLEERVRTGGTQPLVFTLPSGAPSGTGRDELAAIAAQLGPPPTEEDKRVAIAEANLAASRPDLAADERHRQALAAVKRSVVTPDNEVIVFSASPPPGPVPSQPTVVEYNQAVAAAQAQGQTGIVAISPTQAISVPTPGSAADKARSEPNYVPAVFQLQ